ncbi:hypothetical protein C1645_750487 [Glomus cerebriforme]|uniref:Uncharacterized protein n=1 Tax=Glomus cerebriforme TaxID=658196 RepID=A0A397TJ94_9GLOM|nr:hypothetical protein C1645_750487 [Glomus cerebriforme]
MSYFYFSLEYVHYLSFYWINIIKTTYIQENTLSQFINSVYKMFFLNLFKNSILHNCCNTYCS